jgi:hypothetical protein
MISDSIHELLQPNKPQQSRREPSRWFRPKQNAKTASLGVKTFSLNRSCAAIGFVSQKNTGDYCQASPVPCQASSLLCLAINRLADICIPLILVQSTGP